jgi:predicted  nucleic acid-binding Zn-ribbon protein
MPDELHSSEESDLLAQLEERVVRALDAVASLKKEKAALAQQVEQLTAELSAVKSKNKQAASRISKLLEQMDLPMGE